MKLPILELPILFFALLPAFLASGCAGSGTVALDHELATFQWTEERIRTEELIRLYEEQKERSARLTREILALSKLIEEQEAEATRLRAEAEGAGGFQPVPDEGPDEDHSE